MNFPVKLFMVFLTVLLAGAGPVLAVVFPVPNASFEEIVGVKPAQWQIAPNSTPGAFDVSAPEIEAHAGARVLAIRLVTSGAQDSRVSIASAPFQVEGGEYCRLLCWVKPVNWSNTGNTYARVFLTWLDEKTNAVSSRDLYYLENKAQISRDRKDSAWLPLELSQVAPSGARQAQITLYFHAYNPSKEKEAGLLFDDFSFQSYQIPSSVPEGAKKWTYRITSFGVRVPFESDPDSRFGRAQHAFKGRDVAGGLISGPIIADQGVGLYRVAYRMKVADNKKADPVCFIYTAGGGVINSHSMCGRTIVATDFAASNQYQDIYFDFFRPAKGGMQYLCTWLGKVDMWLDTFTVTQLRFLSDNELLASYPVAESTRMKPDPSGGIYLIQGLFYPSWRIDGLAEADGKKIERVSSMCTPGYVSTLAPEFPTDPATFNKLGIIVLADIDAEALTMAGRYTLRQFVQAGGTLIVLGGWFSFGQARMKGTFLEDMLPVTCPGPFDLKKCKPPALLVLAGNLPAAEGLFGEEKPVCLWMHQLMPKPGARVLVTAGGMPFMVTGSYGKGKVIVCAGTVLGSVPKDVLPFWEWKNWPRLLLQALTN